MNTSRKRTEGDSYDFPCKDAYVRVLRDYSSCEDKFTPFLQWLLKDIRTDFENAKKEPKLPVSFRQTQARLKGVLDKTFENTVKQVLEPTKIIATSESRPRLELLQKMLGPKSVHENGYKMKDPSYALTDLKEYPAESFLILTALQKSLEYLQTKENGGKGNEVIISQVTKMYQQGKILDKIESKCEFSLSSLFDNDSPITAITAVVMISGGYFFTYNDFKDFTENLNESVQSSLDTETTQAFFHKAKLVDAKGRLLVSPSYDARNISDENLSMLVPTGEHILAKIRSQVEQSLQLVGNRGWHKVRIGTSAAVLTFRPKNDKLEDYDRKLLLSLYEDDNQHEKYKNLNPGLVFKDQNQKNEIPAGKQVFDLLHAYWGSERYIGRAAGIGIQDRDLFIAVKQIEGNPFTIVGLPTDLVFRFLHDFGVPVDIPDLEDMYWPTKEERRKIVESEVFHSVTMSEAVDHGLKNLEDARKCFFYLEKDYAKPNYQRLADRAQSLYADAATSTDKILSMSEVTGSMKALETASQKYCNNDEREGRHGKNGIRLNIARALASLGHALFEPSETKIKLSIFRPLDDCVESALNDPQSLKDLSLNADSLYATIEPGLTWTKNQEVIERGLREFNNYLQGIPLEKRARFLMQHRLVGELAELESKLERLPSDTHTLKEKYKHKRLDTLRKECNAIKDSLHQWHDEWCKDAFNKVFEANQGTLQTSANQEYIVDHRQYLWEYVEELEKNSPGAGILIALGNHGMETMGALWLALTLIKRGFTVTVAPKRWSSLWHDCSVQELVFILPYFDALVRNVFPAEKALLDYFPDKFRVAGVDENGDIVSDPGSYIEDHDGLGKHLAADNTCMAVILLGEVWYTELVGQDELDRLPYNNFRQDVLLFSIHIHKTRDKPLAVMNERIFLTKGEFVKNRFTTGWRVAQGFWPVIGDQDQPGWHRFKKKYTVETSPENDVSLVNFLNDLGSDKLKDVSIEDVENQIVRDCRAYAGLNETTDKLLEHCYEDNGRKIIVYRYVSPHKGVTLTIMEDTVTIELYMEYDDRRIMRTGGTEWKTLKGKITELLASIFRGLLFKTYGNTVRLIDSEDSIEVGQKKIHELATHSLKKMENIPDDMSLDRAFLFARLRYRVKHLESYADHVYADPVWRTRLVPARYDLNSKSIMICIDSHSKKIDNHACCIVDGIVMVPMSGEKHRPKPCLVHLTKSDWFQAIKTGTNCKNDSCYCGALTVAPAPLATRKDIKNAGVLVAPMDTLTTCDAREKLIEHLDQHKAPREERLVAFTEFVRVGAVFLQTFKFDDNYWHDNNFLTGLPRMEISTGEGPIICQLAGPHNLPIEARSSGLFGPKDLATKDEITNEVIEATADTFAATALLAQYIGVSGIDINMGCCPMYSQGGGVKLTEVSRSEMAEKIIKKVKDALEKSPVKERSPMCVSVKTRLVEKHEVEWSVDEAASKKFYGKLFKAGADWITVHTRIRNDGQGTLGDGKARINRDIFGKIVQELIDEKFIGGKDDPFFVLNGEIIDMRDVKAVKEVAHCDVGMVALGLRRDELLLLRCKQYLQGKETPKDPPCAALECAKEDYKKYNSAERQKVIRELIRGHDCANCEYRISCEPKTRCRRAAKRIIDGDKGFLKHVLKRLRDPVRREKLLKLTQYKDKYL